MTLIVIRPDTCFFLDETLSEKNHVVRTYLHLTQKELILIFLLENRFKGEIFQNINNNNIIKIKFTRNLIVDCSFLFLN